MVEEKKASKKPAADRTKGTLIFDGLPPGSHTWWSPRQKDGTDGYERIEPGRRLEGVDLEVNPELRGPLSTGAARWEE